MENISFAQAAFSFLKDKKVEIFTGTYAKEHKYADYSVNHKDVIRGILRNVVGDLMMVEVVGVNGETNLVYINCWSVVSMIEPKNNISIIDIYFDADEKHSK